MIKDIFKKSSIDLEKVLIPINCSKTEFGYRNKLQVAVQKQGDQICFGLYAARSNRVVPMTTCLIAGTLLNSVFHALQQFVLDYSPTIYDSESSTDGLRHLVIRESQRTQEVMVAMVMSEQNREFETAVQDFCSKLESVKSVMVNYNSEATDEVLGNESLCLFGRPYIVDQILGLKIKVSLHSFMQANTVMVESLYQAIMMAAKLTGSEKVLDAYCGVGALTLSLAKQAKHVVGVERNPQAIDNAKQNQALNQVTNVEFYCESVESWLRGQLLAVDVVVVDPPRQGCHPRGVRGVCSVQNQTNYLLLVQCSDLRERLACIT